MELDESVDYCPAEPTHPWPAELSKRCNKAEMDSMKLTVISPITDNYPTSSETW